MASIADIRNQFPDKTAGLTDLEIADTLARKTGRPLALVAGDLGVEIPKQNSGLMGDTFTALKSGAQQVPGMITGLVDIPFGLAGADHPISKGWDYIGEATGFQPGSWSRDTQREYSPGTVAARSAVDAAEGFWDTAGAFATNPRAAYVAGVESVPSMVAGGVAGRGLMAVAPRVGGAVAGAAGEGAVMAGQSMDSINSNVDPRTAALASLGIGVAGGAVGLAGAKLANRLGLEDVDVLATGSRRLTDAAPMSIYKRVPAGFVQEGFLEEAPQSAIEQMGQNWAEGKDITDGLGKAVAAGIATGGLMGGATNVMAAPRRVDMLARREETDLLQSTGERLDSFSNTYRGTHPDYVGPSTTTGPQNMSLDMFNQYYTPAENSPNGGFPNSMVETYGKDPREITRDIMSYRGLQMPEQNTTGQQFDFTYSNPNQAEMSFDWAPELNTTMQPLQPLQPRIDQRFPAPRPGNKKDVEAAYNEPSGQWVIDPVTQHERQLTMGEWYEIQSGTPVAEVLAPVQLTLEAAKTRKDVKTWLDTQLQSGAITPEQHADAINHVDQAKGANAKLEKIRTKVGAILNPPKPVTKGEIFDASLASIVGDENAGIFDAVFNQGKTVEAVGQELDINKSTVSRRVGQARNAVLKHLAEAHGVSTEVAADILREYFRAQRNVQAADTANLGMSPASQASTLDEQELFGSENGAEQHMGTIETVGGSQGAVGRSELPPSYVDSVEPNDNARAAAAANRQQHLQDLLNHPESRTALNDWDREDVTLHDLVQSQDATTDYLSDYIEAVANAEELGLDEHSLLEHINKIQAAIADDIKKGKYGPEQSIRGLEQNQSGDAGVDGGERPDVRQIGQGVQVEAAPDAGNSVRGKEPAQTGTSDEVKPAFTPIKVSGRLTRDKVYDVLGQLERAKKLDQWGHKAYETQLFSSGGVKEVFSKLVDRGFVEYDDEVRYSKNQPSSGTTADAIKSAVKSIFPGGVTSRVTVYQSADEAVAAGKLQSQEAKGVQAWVDGNRVFFIADNIPAGNELAVALHEIGAHIGLENMLNDREYRNLVSKIFEWERRADGSLESRIAKAALARVDAAVTNDADYAPETIAYFIEEAVKAGVNPTALNYKTEIGRWLEKIKNAFRVALHNLGFRMDKLTAQNVVDLAYGAAHIELKGAQSEPAGRVETGTGGRIETGAGAERAIGGPVRPDWREATAIRNVAGEPLTAFRGTKTGYPTAVESWSDEHLGKATGHASAYLGVWFTNKESDARIYGDNVESFHLDVRNPKVYNANTWQSPETPAQAKALRKQLIAAGYDGIAIDYRSLQGPLQVVSFDAIQAIPAEKKRFSKNYTESLPKDLQEPARDIVNGLKNAGRVALNYAAFTSDLVEMAKKFMPAVGAWYDSVHALEVERIQQEQRVEAIAAEFADMDRQKFKDTWAAIHLMTREQKWGYQPTWRGPVEINPAAAAAYNKLDAQQRELLDRVFKHGHDQLTETQAVLDETIANAYADELAEADTSEKKAIVQRKIDRYKAIYGRELAKMKGPYAPMRRVGSHVVVAKSQAYLDAEAANDTKELEKLKAEPTHFHVEFVDSMVAAQRKARELDGRFEFVKASEKDAYMQDNQLPFQAFEQLRRMVDEKDKRNGEGAKKLNAMITELYLTSLAETSSRKSEMKRDNVAGIEDHMFKAFVSKGRASAHYIAQLKIGKTVGDNLATIRQQAHDHRDERAMMLFNELYKRYTNATMFNPSPVVNKLMAVNSVWSLLTKPAYYFYNLTQPTLMTQPWLSQKHGYKKSGAAMLKAFEELTAIKGYVKQPNFSVGSMPADVRAAMQDLMNQGKLDITIAQDLGEYMKEGDGEVSRAVNWANQKLRFAAQKVETTNRIVTGIAAYRLEHARLLKEGRSPAAAHSGAVEYAAKAIDETQGDYSNLNAPRLMNATSIQRLVTQFRKFQLIQISFLVRMVKDATVGGTKEEKAAARAALMYVLGHHAVLAGAMGLPAANLVALVFSAFGDDDDDRDLELEARKALGNGFAADLLTRGVPAAVFNINLSNNVGMGQAFSIMPYEEVDLSRDGYSKMLTAMSGPFFGGLAPRAVEGMGKIYNGDFYRGMEGLLPSGFAATARALREMADGQTNSREDVLVSPEEISMLATVGKALGFRMQNDSTTSLIRTRKYELEQFFNERTSLLKNRYAAAYRDGDGEELADIREHWQEMQAFKRDYGFKPQPLSNLLKAPAEQRKRERQTRGGVQYNSGSEGFVEQYEAEE